MITVHMLSYAFLFVMGRATAGRPYNAVPAFEYRGQ